MHPDPCLLRAARGLAHIGPSGGVTRGPAGCEHAGLRWDLRRLAHGKAAAEKRERSGLWRQKLFSQGKGAKAQTRKQFGCEVSCWRC